MADEVGFMMTPSVKKTWAPQAHTPSVPYRNRRQRKVHPRLALHYLPPYAPDLNAQEGVWCLTKHHRMANHTIDKLEALHAEAERHLRDVGNDQRLLRSCFAAAGLALTIASAQ